MSPYTLKGYYVKNGGMELQVADEPAVQRLVTALRDETKDGKWYGVEKTQYADCLLCNKGIDVESRRGLCECKDPLWTYHGFGIGSCPRIVERTLIEPLAAEVVTP